MSTGLTLVANELVPVYRDANKEHRINARDLYVGLKIGQKYTDWIKDRIERYGFEEDVDFFRILGKSTGGRPKTEYYFTIDTAKEIAMVENNDQGKRVRKYFIAIENKAREMFQTPQCFSEALQLAADLQKQIETNAPKVLFADTCLKSRDSVLIRELAKIACDQNINTGERRLFKALRNWGMLSADNEPYQRYIDAGYFEVIERPITTYDGIKLKMTTKVTPKGQVHIIERLRKESAV